MEDRVDLIKSIENSLKSLPTKDSYSNFVELVYDYERELAGLKSRVSGLESSIVKMSAVLELVQDWILNKKN